MCGVRSKAVYSKLSEMIRDKKVSVLGLGVSNLPLVKLLLELGEARSITVYDKRSVSELGEEAGELLGLGVAFCTDFSTLSGDVIFRSPGFRPDREEIANAVARGAVLTSEIEELLKIRMADTFGITGSDGKTTSTTLTSLFLSKQGKTYVGGNIGTPLLSLCDDMGEKDSVVLELSSFQLMTLRDAPICSAVTNISPNHLDWHKDLDEYELAKRNIVGERTKRAVLNAECKETLQFGSELCREKEVIFFSSKKKGYSELPEEVRGGNTKLIFLCDGEIMISDGEKEEALLSLSKIRLPGVHNIENYMTAIGLTYGYAAKEVYGEVAREFCGVEHRLELVATVEGVDYYNSSIDSSPTRTAAALSALHGRDMVVICGGYDKNLSYEPLAKSLFAEARAVVLTGATAAKIKAAIDRCREEGAKGLEVVDADSFEDAVARAARLSRKGGCVLLSPASASFDRFKNFMERGRYFKELVRNMAKEKEN